MRTTILSIAFLFPEFFSSSQSITSKPANNCKAKIERTKLTESKIVK